MDDPELPGDLADLEKELAARPVPEPSRRLRGRVMAAMRRDSVGALPVEPVALWRFAAIAGALLLLLLNLSMSVANHADWDVSGQPLHRNVASAARKLREAVPELSEREALRITLVMQSGSRLVPMPDLKGRPGGSMALE